MKAVNFFFFILLTTSSVAQNTPLKSWVPATAEIHGRWWNSGYKETYDRMPASAEGEVRKEVWDLSRRGAGLHLLFRSNAPEIIVRYTVSNTLQMPHMPATGVSGVDLYAKDKSGSWGWSAGKYNFGDTISFTFSGFAAETIRDHVLYLPMYNHIKWLEVKYPASSSFEVVTEKDSKPVVVYGTSIANGACATRPGLGWTNILSRLIDKSVINLAFSGNGRLEYEVYKYIGEIDASLFILDCLPNMSGDVYIKEGILRRRLDSSFQYLRSLHPNTPILFTEHAGYGDEDMNAKKKETYMAANAVLLSYYESLKRAGVKNIGYLSKKEIGLTIESTVDGIHPNDIGMMENAKAYARKIKKVFKL
ncbi:MAG: hypothetical protein RL335_104 [Bacteroidota bacterium]|jgi:GDSL-like Lipase/Acylhydrolase family/N-terminus of Esterase_SGNH_hydro-type